MIKKGFTLLIGITWLLLSFGVNDLADETGWTFLANLGNYILKKGSLTLILEIMDFPNYYH